MLLYPFIELFLWWGFLFATVIQLAVWLAFPLRMLAKAQRSAGAIGSAMPDINFEGTSRVLPDDQQIALPLTVLICARNEADNLQKHLPFILNQHYAAAFEVLVVDDDSSDNTTACLLNLQHKYPHLNVLRMSPKQYIGKKHALAQGIAAARYDWLVVTDADCQPVGSDWLTRMMAAAHDQSSVQIILGYAPLYPSTGRWIPFFARFETAYTGMQYASMALSGMPYMGVGRNMAWHRSLFKVADGFKKHQHIASGDDDLFVNAVATPENTRLCLAPQTFMYSPAKTTVSAWLRQKQRHLSAGLWYAPWPQLAVGAVAFTHACHYGLAVILCILQYHAGWVLSLYLLRVAIVWYTYAKWMRILKEPRFIAGIPVLDGLLAVYFGAVAPYLMVFNGKNTRW